MHATRSAAQSEGRRTSRPSTLFVLISILTLVSAVPVSAQRADFLFGRPVATVSLMTGWAMPGEGSDLFAQARDEVTIRRGDFASAPFLFELGVHAGERLDLAAGFEYAGRSVRAEWRDWVTADDLPIYQTTAFRRWRLTGGLKAYLFPRGRSISEYVWIPRGWTPYVAAGVGVTWYDFTQRGDFVVYEPGANEGDIYGAEVTSRGHGFTPYAATGLDVTLSRYFILRMEVRQHWGDGGVDPTAFTDFNDIDLSGLTGTIGIAFRTGGRGL